MAEKEKTELYLFNLFKHECKWSEVDEEGYQSCSKCGKKEFIGLPTCNHKWTEPDNNRQTCTTCGEVREIECSHQWKPLTANKMLCEKCGEVEVTKCDHEWEDIEGELYQRCIKCNDKVSFDCSHEWEDVDDNTQQCKVCG